MTSSAVRPPRDAVPSDLSDGTPRPLIWAPDDGKSPIKAPEQLEEEGIRIAVTAIFGQKARTPTKEA